MVRAIPVLKAQCRRRGSSAIASVDHGLDLPEPTCSRSSARVARSATSTAVSRTCLVAAASDWAMRSSACCSRSAIAFCRLCRGAWPACGWTSSRALLRMALGLGGRLGQRLLGRCLAVESLVAQPLGVGQRPGDRRRALVEQVGEARPQDLASQHDEQQEGDADPGRRIAEDAARRDLHGGLRGLVGSPGAYPSAAVSFVAAATLAGSALCRPAGRRACRRRLGRDVVRHVLEACPSPGRAARRCAARPRRCAVDHVVQLGEPGRGGGAVGLGLLAVSRRAVLAGVGQALLVGGDQRAGLLVRLLGRVEVALDLGLALVERVGDRAAPRASTSPGRAPRRRSTSQTSCGAKSWRLSCGMPPGRPRQAAALGDERRRQRAVDRLRMMSVPSLSGLRTRTGS